MSKYIPPQKRIPVVKKEEISLIIEDDLKEMFLKHLNQKQHKKTKIPWSLEEENYLREMFLKYNSQKKTILEFITKYKNRTKNAAISKLMRLKKDEGYHVPDNTKTKKLNEWSDEEEDYLFKMFVKYSSIKVVIENFIKKYKNRSENAVKLKLSRKRKDWENEMKQNDTFIFN